MSLEKEFVPYEEALTLKELGFDEPCFYQYVRDFDNDGELIPIVSDSNYPILRNNTQVSNCSGGDCFAAPLYQQAFRWFREKYNYYISVFRTHDGSWGVDLWLLGVHKPKATIFSETYEEAELACLKKLIKIAKNK